MSDGIGSENKTRITGPYSFSYINFFHLRLHGTFETEEKTYVQNLDIELSLSFNNNWKHLKLKKITLIDASPRD